MLINLNSSSCSSPQFLVRQELGQSRVTGMVQTYPLDGVPISAHWPKQCKGHTSKINQKYIQLNEGIKGFQTYTLVITFFTLDNASMLFCSSGVTPFAVCHCKLKISGWLFKTKQREWSTDCSPNGADLSEQTVWFLTLSNFLSLCAGHRFGGLHHTLPHLAWILAPRTQ